MTYGSKSCRTSCKTTYSTLSVSTVSLLRRKSQSSTSPSSNCRSTTPEMLQLAAVVTASPSFYDGVSRQSKSPRHSQQQRPSSRNNPARLLPGRRHQPMRARRPPSPSLKIPPRSLRRAWSTSTRPLRRHLRVPARTITPPPSSILRSRSPKPRRTSARTRRQLHQPRHQQAPSTFRHGAPGRMDSHTCCLISGLSSSGYCSHRHFGVGGTRPASFGW